MSTSCHPQTDGQSERTIQAIEDMFMVCVMDFKGNWGDHLLWIEVLYNNSYHACIAMLPYEALYGRKYRFLICWEEVGERKVLGPELVQHTKKIIEIIKKRMFKAQSRKQKYADPHRKQVEF